MLGLKNQKSPDRAPRQRHRRGSARPWPCLQRLDAAPVVQHRMPGSGLQPPGLVLAPPPRRSRRELPRIAGTHSVTIVANECGPSDRRSWWIGGPVARVRTPRRKSALTSEVDLVVARVRQVRGCRLVDPTRIGREVLVPVLPQPGSADRACQRLTRRGLRQGVMAPPLATRSRRRRPPSRVAPSGPSARHAAVGKDRPLPSSTHRLHARSAASGPSALGRDLGGRLAADARCGESRQDAPLREKSPRKSRAPGRSNATVSAPRPRGGQAKMPRGAIHGEPRLRSLGCAQIQPMAASRTADRRPPQRGAWRPASLADPFVVVHRDAVCRIARVPEERCPEWRPGQRALRAGKSTARRWTTALRAWPRTEVTRACDGTQSGREHLGCHTAGASYRGRMPRGEKERDPPRAERAVGMHPSLEVRL